MNIVLVNRWYPPYSGGGVASYNQSLGRALVQQGHKVTVLAAQWNREVNTLQNDRGVIIHRILYPAVDFLLRLPLIKKFVRPLQQYLYSYQVANKLREIERNNKPDIIEFAEVNAEAFVYLQKKKRVPVVVRCHTPTFVLRNYYFSNEMPYNTWLTEWMEKYCIKHANLLTAPSNDMTKTITSSCNFLVGKMAVIPNAVDVDVFTPTENGALKQNKKDVIILHVGRLERIKGLVVLAEAIPQVLAAFPNVKFVFIGAAESDIKTKMWTEQLKLAGGDCVHVLGFLEQEEMVNWYHKADIAVVPSLNYESFSYTCAQAMAAGLPVVASRIGGIPETVDDGINGILVEPGSVTDLIEALGKLVKDRKFRKDFGIAGHRKAGMCFNSDIIAQRMVQLYTQLVSNSQQKHSLEI